MNYRKVEEADLAFFRSLLPGRVFAGANRNVNISEDGVGVPGKGEKRVITGEFFRFLYANGIFSSAENALRPLSTQYNNHPHGGSDGTT